MAKKSKVPFRHEMDDLTTIDDELDGAIAQLDETNTRIGALLQTIEPPKQIAQPGSAVDETTESQETGGTNNSTGPAGGS